ncbi:MAG: APC family permease [Solirubrobacterales bacterium]|nr:APC family permease [Solirubrobacterales bacterium]MBV9683028.1 APC family permease [Solirubrobacterales bacterium]MBV9811098.1 APC family permease [Solirubrobacterales bacterium]
MSDIAPQQPHHGPEVDSELLLEDMGYEPQLQRGLNILGNLALTLSDITPTASLLVVATAVIATAGTGSLWAYLIGGFIAVNVALCMGELGSMFPVAGGLYSIVTRVLGRPIGFLALLDYIGQAIFLPASVAFGIGTYINALYPSLSTKWIAAGMMIFVALIACLDVRFNAWMIAFFLALEIGVVIMLALAGFLHPHQSLSTFTHPHMAAGTNRIGPVGISAIIAALATALFSVNGYDSAINFSEETEGAASDVGKAVVLAASIGIVFEIIPFIGVSLGAKDLNAFLHSSTPLTDVVRSSFGHTAVDIVTWGAILAIFNASLAITLQFARVTYASGRDMAWPAPISRALSYVNPRFKMPWVATMLVGVLGGILCAQSSLISVVTFTAVLIVILYALIAISALVSRVRQKDLERPFRMPLWPVPPLIALIGVGLALSQQKGSDLIICAAIFVGGAVYYFTFLRPRQDRYWSHLTVPEHELSTAAEANR